MKKVKNIGIRLPADLDKYVREKAEQNQRSVSGQVRYMIIDYMRNIMEQEKKREAA